MPHKLGSPAMGVPSTRHKLTSAVVPAAPSIGVIAHGSSAGATVTTLSFSATVSGTNRALLVAVQLAAAQTITTMTWNGTAMTFLDAERPDVNAITRRTELWGLIAPAAATGNVVMNTDGNVALEVQAIVVVNASQTAPFGTPVKNGTSSGTSIALTATGTGNDLVLACAAARTTGVLTYGAAQTQQYTALGGTNNRVAVTSQAANTAGSFAWATAADEGAAIAVAVHGV